MADELQNALYKDLNSYCIGDQTTMTLLIKHAEA